MTRPSFINCWYWQTILIVVSRLAVATTTPTTNVQSPARHNRQTSLQARPGGLGQVGHLADAPGQGPGNGPHHDLQPPRLGLAGAVHPGEHYGSRLFYKSGQFTLPE